METVVRRLDIVAAQAYIAEPAASLVLAHALPPRQSPDPKYPPTEVAEAPKASPARIRPLEPAAASMATVDPPPHTAAPVANLNSAHVPDLLPRLGPALH